MKKQIDIDNTIMNAIEEMYSRNENPANVVISFGVNDSIITINHIFQYIMLNKDTFDLTIDWSALNE